VTSDDKRVVFISYSHRDSGFVNEFAATLLRYDLQIWKDSKDIPIGGNIPKSIYGGIKNASHFCCIISASSVKSTWVEEELSFAKIRQLGDSGLRIIPILIDKVEIPDYVTAYLCAHLEDRNLAIANPEFLKVLKAFGTDLEEYARNLITGKHREALLAACEKLQADLALFREILGNFRTAYIRYQTAISNRGYDPPEGIDRRGTGNVQSRPTTYGSDYLIKNELMGVTTILMRLKVDASDVQASLELVRKVWDEADPARKVSTLLGLLYDSLDRVSYISRTVAAAPDEKDWWIREKLSAWVEHLAASEISVGSAITLLRSWASFDPK
jgi:TIR domain